MSASVSCEALCRLCLSSRGRLLPIFGGPDPGDLAGKIRACVAVQVKEDDELPTRVCAKCLDNVNNWHLFKKVCDRSQVKLAVLTKKESSHLEPPLKIKSEPLNDEIYDDEVVIDAAYPDYEQNASANKIQPEGPPILASLGLAPRSDKAIESEKDEEEDEEEEEEQNLRQLRNDSQRMRLRPTLPTPEVSITVMRPTGETLQSRQGIQQLASKNCLVCGRAYRYSHNARRHELTSHCFDRYTNKINKNLRPNHHSKLRPNPFNPKARLMPNPINPKIQFMPKGISAKMHFPVKHQSKNQSRNNLPYPLRIKALTDLQVQKKKEPEILKSLLTARAKAMVHDRDRGRDRNRGHDRGRDIINSGPESPETLISEPEIASFQVETIITEPDAFVNEEENEEEMEVDVETPHTNYDTVDMGSDHEIEIATQQDMSNDSRSKDELKDDDQHEQEHEGEEEQDEGVENDDEVYEEITPDQDARSEGHNSIRSNTEAIIENGIGEHGEDDEGENDIAVEQEEDNVEKNEENGEEYDDEMLPPIAPIVEINEDPQTNSFTSEIAEEEEEEDSAEITEDTIEEPSMLEPARVLEPSKQYLTKRQRDFILKHRDVIEQVNTKQCKCCEKVHPRRKAVIQHLQKNGHHVPKHTCYNCVITFSHIGALLSHMRTNSCTNLWKLIYSEDGISEDLLIEGEDQAPEISSGKPLKDKEKVQYKDILNSRSYACKFCPAKFQLKQFIMKHVLEVHEDGQSQVPLACVHCGYRFKDNRLWKKHIRNGECTVDIACDLCPEKFMSILQFNDHAVAVHAGSFDTNDNKSKQLGSRPTDCPLCQKNHSNYHNLVKHLKTFHNEDRPYFCSHCDTKFETLADLNQHIYMEHSGRPAVNQDLDMSIVKEEAEEYHYSCTECNSIFETVDAWTDHQVAEHNQVAHHCDQCEKKFLRPSELAEHKNTHLRVKYYSCSVCPNTYSTPQKLSDHVQQSHPGSSAAASSAENQFYCELCIRGFKSRQAYSNHMRIHAKVPTTNRKPGDHRSSQPMIGKQIRHQPSHSSSYIHFKSKYNNVPNAPYSCDICGKGFMHKKNIWKHKKVLHADIVGEKNDSEENTMNASTEGEEESQENGTGLSIPQFNSFNFANYTAPPATKDGLPFGCEICFKKFPLRTSLWKHKRAKHGIINVSANPQEHSGEGGGSRSSCTICKISFADKKSYYRHRKNVHKTNVQMCKICGKPLNSTLELYEHLKAVHARELLGYNANAPKLQEVQAPSSNDYEYLTEDREEITDGVEYQARYPCDTCGKQFVGMLALQNHQCLQDPTQPSAFDCEICNKSYTSIAALKSHRGWHLRSPDGKAAANNSGLWMPHHKVTNKHSKFEVLDAPPVTRFNSSSSSSLTVTKRRLPPEVEVTVVNPNKKIRSDDSVSEAEVLSHLAQRSQAAAEPDERYCSLCDKEFTKKAAYQRHMDEVHRPNSVFCPVCDKSFTRKSTLLVHMRKHYDDGGEGMSPEPVPGPSKDTNDEIYACDLCGAQYHSSKALRVHRMRHHGEDEEDSEEEEASAAPPAAPGEFTCNQCGDGVATPRDLLAHRSMHATPSKFFCQICKVYFPRALDLSSHTRARHSDNDKVFFPCAMCDRFYMNKKSLQRHIETSH